MGFGAELIATDLDGTLWGRTVEVHPSTRDALGELSRRGVPVLAATGRRPRSARDGFDRNDILLPAVLLDGTIGEDFPAGTRFHESFFTSTVAAIVADRFLAAGLQPCVYVDDPAVDLLVGDSPSTDPRHLASVRAYSREVDLSTVAVDHGAILAFTIIGADPSVVTPLAAAINAEGVAEATVVDDSLYGGVSIAVIPADVTKWTGVLAYCHRHDIDPAGVVAVGDAGNDLDLLANAGLSVVPRTAGADIRAVADVEIGGPDEGGWADLLDLVD